MHARTRGIKHGKRPPPVRVSTDSALHGRCDRAPVGLKDVKSSTTHGMNGVLYVLNSYALAGEWGAGGHLLAVPRL